MLRFSNLTVQNVIDQCRKDDLDEALGPIMRIIDSENKHDLGGHAGHWFHGDAWSTDSHFERLTTMFSWLATLEESKTSI